jgi:hypothetical protein
VPDDAAKRKPGGGVFGTFNRASDTSPSRVSGNMFSTSTIVSSPPPPGKNTPDAFIIADEQTMTPTLEHEDEEPDVMFDASEEQEEQQKGSQTKASTNNHSKKIDIQTDNQDEEANKQVSSADLIKEIDEIAPGDKEGDDIDPFFDDD